MLWIILTFIVGLGAVIIAGVEILNGQPLNTFIASILLAVLSHAFTIGGSVNTSSQLESNSASMITNTASLSNQVSPTHVP